MILEVRKFPESQEVMEDSEWFLVMDTNPNENKLGQSSYARILDKSEYILVEKTTADEFNKDFIEVEKASDSFFPCLSSSLLFQPTTISGLMNER